VTRCLGCCDDVIEIVTSEDVFVDPVCLEFRTKIGDAIVSVVEDERSHVGRLELAMDVADRVIREVAPYDAAGAIMGLPLLRPRHRFVRRFRR
jgi:hypothetical protein